MMIPQAMYTCTPPGGGRDSGNGHPLDATACNTGDWAASSHRQPAHFPGSRWPRATDAAGAGLMRRTAGPHHNPEIDDPVAEVEARWHLEALHHPCRVACVPRRRAPPSHPTGAPEASRPQCGGTLTPVLPRRKRRGTRKQHKPRKSSNILHAAAAVCSSIRYTPPPPPPPRLGPQRQVEMVKSPRWRGGALL